MRYVNLTKNKERLIVKNNNLKSQLINKKYGFKKDLIYYLDLFEGRYLLDKKKLKIKSKGKVISIKKYKKICNRKIKDFEDKYLVFKDFRDQGKVIKDGTKFGFDFRIYKNTKKHTHTEAVVDLKKSYKDSIIKIIKSERLASSINTDYIIAIVDLEKNIIKLKIKRTK